MVMMRSGRPSESDLQSNAMLLQLVSCACASSSSLLLASSLSFVLGSSGCPCFVGLWTLRILSCSRCQI
jgi:hypothetical protein